MRVPAAALCCLPGLLDLAACAANPLGHAKPDGSANPALDDAAAGTDLAMVSPKDAPATGADALIIHVNFDLMVRPDIDLLLCRRTLSDEEQPGFPLDWSAAKEATAWCAFSGPSLEWSSVEDPGGYNQVVLGIYTGGEMIIWQETIYLYDANTGKFVQEIFAYWDYTTTCGLRAADAPASAVSDGFGYHPGTMLQSLCPPRPDAGL